jgi:hypothetical protein
MVLHHLGKLLNFDLRKRVDLGVKNRGKWFAKASAINCGSVIILVPIDSSTNKQSS